MHQKPSFKFFLFFSHAWLLTTDCQGRTGRRPTCTAQVMSMAVAVRITKPFSYVKFLRGPLSDAVLILYFPQHHCSLCFMSIDLENSPNASQTYHLYSGTYTYSCRRRWWITHPCHDQCESSSSSSTKGDQQSLTQIFMCISSNSIKYQKLGGSSSYPLWQSTCWLNGCLFLRLPFFQGFVATTSVLPCQNSPLPKSSRKEGSLPNPLCPSVPYTE